VTIHLSILLYWPLALAAIAAFMPRRVAPAIGLLASLVPVSYAVLFLFDFETKGGLQYVTDDRWIEELGIRYSLGIDGLNLWLIALTTLLFFASALWTTFRPMPRPRLYQLHMALLETAVLGALMAQDLALFVLFFDLMLVPVYFLVGQWGGPARVQATVKLVIYTLVGSLIMLAAAVATAILSRGDGEELSFDLQALAGGGLPESTQKWIFAGFALAFLIKMPLLPFQGWMPEGYRNMPIPVLVVFSGVVSKVAAYGFLKIVLPILPDATEDFRLPVLILALVTIIYGSAQAFTQTEARLILGYSSMAQLGFIVLGVFAADSGSIGEQGALLQMVNHGLVVAPVFFIIALLAERAGGSEDIKDMGGVAFRAPVLAVLFLISALATLAIPGSANFVGEFLILLGLFRTELPIAAIAFTGVAMASVYMLRMFIRAMHNRTGPRSESAEIAFKDALVVVPLVIAILALGLYPQQALEHSEQAVKASTAPLRERMYPKAQVVDAVQPAAIPGAGGGAAAGGVAIDPNTGQQVDPSTPGAVIVDPTTGQPLEQPGTGGAAAPEEVPTP
jgi:NADH-quinone oxidoreductase subunit M